MLQLLYTAEKLLKGSPSNKFLFEHAMCYKDSLTSHLPCKVLCLETAQFNEFSGQTYKVFDTFGALQCLYTKIRYS